eukprot:9148413-Pyramimonas_sp.AAC.1
MVEESCIGQVWGLRLLRRLRVPGNASQSWGSGTTRKTPSRYGPEGSCVCGKTIKNSYDWHEW